MENFITLKQKSAEVTNALISAELKQSLKLSEHDCEKESHLFGTEIEPQLLKDSTMVWVREQIKKQLTNQGVEIFKQIGMDVQGILFVTFAKCTWCYYITFTGCSGDLLMAKLNNLPTLISSRIEKDKQQKKVKEENLLMMKEQQSKYTSTLLESLAIMEELVEKHLIEFQSEQYNTKGVCLILDSDIPI